MLTARCNGFRIRGLNADCDRVAIQSSEQDTWQLGRKSGWLGLRRGWHEVGLQQNELMVIRPYGGAAPEYEIEALGERAGVLILQKARGGGRTLRVGSKVRLALGEEESLVIRCEWIQYPHSAGVAPGAYGSGLAV